jgi:hypothetical protein
MIKIKHTLALLVLMSSVVLCSSSVFANNRNPYEKIMPPERVLRGGKIFKWERLDPPPVGATITDDMVEPVRITTPKLFTRVMYLKSKMFFGYERSIASLKVIVYTTPPEFRQYIFPLLAEEKMPDEIRNIPIVKAYYKKLPTNVADQAKGKIEQLRPDYYFLASPLVWLDSNSDIEGKISDMVDVDDLDKIAYNRPAPPQLTMPPSEMPQVMIGSSEKKDYNNYLKNPYNNPTPDNDGNADGAATKTPGSKGVGVLGASDIELFINACDDLHNNLDSKYIEKLYTLRTHYRGVLNELAHAITGGHKEVENNTAMKELVFRLKSIGAYYDVVDILKKHDLTVGEWVAIGDKAIRVYRYEKMDARTVNQIKSQKIAQYEARQKQKEAAESGDESGDQVDVNIKMMQSIVDAQVDALFSLVNVPKQDWKNIRPYVNEFSKKVLKGRNDIFGVTIVL